MYILDLPPEILFEIFSHTIPNFPSLGFYSDYLERNQTLLPHCLVHPRWTRQAQELLRKEVWVQAYEAEEREMEERGRQLPSRGAQYLSIEGNTAALLEGSRFERWKGVILLQSRQLDPNVEPTNFEDFARFPSESARSRFQAICVYLMRKYRPQDAGSTRKKLQDRLIRL